MLCNNAFTQIALSKLIMYVFSNFFVDYIRCNIWKLADVSN